ncbi:MAG: glycosyltransferase family 2 protein [Terracidiphilus sp.]
MLNLKDADAMPKVTVIIAAYNCSHTLKCALTSLCNQTYGGFEAWVVGDCCTDDSEQIVAGFCDPRLNWTNLPQRVGSQSGPNNEGLRRARGEYIAYLGQDDLWFPWHLKSLVTTMEETNADFVHAIVARLHPLRPAEAEGVPNGRRSYGSRFVPPSGWMHKHKIVETCGFWPLPEDLIDGVDFVFQRRVFFAGYRFASTGKAGVLKFPSPYWRTYARSKDFPQSDYMNRMQQNPDDLHTALLTQLLIASVQRNENLDIWPSLRMLLKTIYWRGIEWYGMDVWPLSSYFKWKQRRCRRRVASLRGLSPISSNAAPTPTAKSDIRNCEATPSPPIR